ncbi:MAG: omptin family outer membrane protease [Treponema sp.]|nr:omptin family outer membrane protease [Treponema sp.]
MYAGAENVSFSSSCFLGLQNTTVCEKLDGKYAPVSRLNWSAPVSIDLGIEEKIILFNFISLFKTQFVIPNAIGTMTDYDYFLSGAVSQYSNHTNHVDNDCCFCIDFGYVIDIGRLSLVPLFGGQYQMRKYSAWDGYVQIPEAGFSWTGSEEKKNIAGNVISYEQHILSPFLKFQIEYDFRQNALVCGTLKYSPYIFAHCIDTHYLRNKQFDDKMRGGFSFGVELRFHFKIFGLIFSYEYTKSGSNANTYVREVGITDSSAQIISGYIPGIESSVWHIGVIYKLSKL